MSWIEVTFDADLRWVERALRELAAATGKPYGEIVRRNGRLIAISLGIQTQPLGDGPEARAQGEKAIRRDMARVFSSPSKVYASLKSISASGKHTGEQLAKAFYKAVKQGDLHRAQEILRSVGIYTPVGKLDPAVHQTRRGARGAVGGKSASLIVTNPKALATYQRKILRNVGIAKGGWAGAAAALGGMRGLPQWVTRHKRLRNRDR